MDEGNQPDKKQQDVEALLRELELQRQFRAAGRDPAARTRARVIAICVLLFLLALLMAGLYYAAEVMKPAPRPVPTDHLQTP